MQQDSQKFVSLLSKMIKPMCISFVSVSLAGCLISSVSMNNYTAKAYKEHITEMRTQKKLDATSNTAKRIQNVFKRIKPHAEADNQTGTKLNWELHVIKSDELNAWAMAGGKMAMYTGLVDKLKLTDDEIATVIGHEMAHVLLEHGKKQANLNVWTSVLAAVGGEALAKVIGDEEIGNEIASGLRDLTISNPYSRSHETEADTIGLFLMAKAGYNPEKAPSVWQKMAKATNASNNRFATLLSTHPSNTDREENLRKLIPQAKALQVQRTTK